MAAKNLPRTVKAFAYGVKRLLFDVGLLSLFFACFQGRAPLTGA